MHRLVLALALVVAADRPADACSVVRTYIAPTNVELVATTPRIVIAKAVDTIAPTTSRDESYVEMEVTAVLKGGGVQKGERFRVRGSTQQYYGASAKTDFSKARKGAYVGSCTAWDYAEGRHYLLFLDSYGGTWATRGTPFTRVNEEVEPANDPWTIAVTKYIAITALATPDDRRKALDALVAAGAKKGATATDKAIAADITAHLAAPTPVKSFAELDAMWRGTTDRSRVAIAIGTGGDPAAKGFMKELVESVATNAPLVDARVALLAIGAYYLKVSDPPVLAKVAELYVALGTQAKQARWDVMWLLIKRADASHRAVMERALAGADDEEAGRLVEWFAKFPSKTAHDDIAKRVGGHYAEKRELALGLAALGDKDIVAWAKKQLAAKQRGDDRWIALYAIAMSPLPEADALVPGILSREGEDLVSLIQGYGKARHAKVDKRLAEIGAKPGLAAEARTWLDRTIADRANPD